MNINQNKHFKGVETKYNGVFNKSDDLPAWKAGRTFLSI
jgi:hypothetical protein